MWTAEERAKARMIAEQLGDIAARACRLAARNRILAEDREAARALGREADAALGWDGMTMVYGAIRSVWLQGLIEGQPPPPRDNAESFHPSSFQAAWDGIGEWRW